MRLLPLLFLALTLFGCQGDGHSSLQNGEGGDTLHLRYARHLTIVEFPNHTEVTLRNPWDTTKIHSRYLLVDKKQNNLHTATTAEQVNVPLCRSAVFGSVHCALLCELGMGEAVSGICDAEFLHIPYYEERLKQGSLINLGSSMQPNMERLIVLSPDALLPSPFENSGGLGRAERLGIPVIWCADYMEQTPLGRAEWIRFYGRLFGCAEKADSIFKAVEHRYLQLCMLAKRANSRPRLLAEKPWSGQWTLPAAGSFSARLYQDAGADYIFSHLKGSGGIPLSTEKVVDKASDADIWIIKHHGNLSRQEMNDDTPLLAEIKAPIWWCNTAEHLLFEQTAFHPERLLESLISTLHPELEVEVQYNYFKPLVQNEL